MDRFAVLLLLFVISPLCWGESKIGWEARLHQLWQQSKKDLREDGATFVVTHSGQGYWLPEASKKRMFDSFKASIDWSKVNNKEDLQRSFEVHTHPPRTWKEYRKVLNYPKESPLDDRFVAEPPSLNDVFIDFDDHNQLPKTYRGRIKYTGVVLNKGGAWTWEKDPNFKLTNAVKIEQGEKLEKTKAKFIELSAKFNGQIDLMLADTAGYQSYRELIERFQALGVKVRFHKAEDFSKIIERPTSGAAPTAETVR